MNVNKPRTESMIINSQKDNNKNKNNLKFTNFKQNHCKNKVRAGKQKTGKQKAGNWKDCRRKGNEYTFLKAFKCAVSHILKSL